MNESTESVEDQFFTIIMILLATGVLGGFSLVGFFQPIQAWAIQQGLMVTSSVTVPLGGDGSAGLDMPRILIAGGVVWLALLGALYSAVRKRRQHQAA